MGRPRSWTDEELIAAVDQSTTIVEVLARLGLAVGGGSLTAVRIRMLELGLDTPDLLRHARSEKWAADPDDAAAHAPARGSWTEDELRMAVVASTSMREVMATLGHPNSGSLWASARTEITRLNLDVSHFGRKARRKSQLQGEDGRRRRSWTDQDLKNAVLTSTSVAGVIRSLGLKVGGTVYPMIQRRISELDLDTSHFTGKGWSKGKSVTCRPGRPLVEILVENST